MTATAILSSTHKLEATLWTAIGQAQLEGELKIASELMALLEGLDRQAAQTPEPQRAAQIQSPAGHPASA